MSNSVYVPKTTITDPSKKTYVTAAYLTDINGNPVGAAAGPTQSARVMSAATTNATSVKATPGTLASVNLFNSGAAAAFFKLYNKASAPTVGTDVPVWTIAVPAGGSVSYQLATGMVFSLGIAYAITNLVADTDTTAVLLSQVTGMITYV